MSVNKKRHNDHIAQRGNFCLVPNELWELDIDHMAKVLWAYILSRPPEWSSSRNNIARNLGMGKDTVTVLLRTLEERKMLAKTVGERGAWSFEIIPPNEWTGPAGSPVGNQTGPEGGPVLDPGEVHTKEGKKNKASSASQNTFSLPESQMSKGTYPTPGPMSAHPQRPAMVPGVILGNPDRLEEGDDQVTFSDIVNNWLSSENGRLAERLSSSQRSGHLAALLEDCKRVGLRRSHVDAAVFKRKVLASAPFIKKKTEWQEEVWEGFDRAVSVVYAPRAFKCPPNETASTDAELEYLFNNFKELKNKETSDGKL